MKQRWYHYVTNGLMGAAFGQALHVVLYSQTLEDAKSWCVGISITLVLFLIMKVYSDVQMLSMSK